MYNNINMTVDSETINAIRAFVSKIWTLSQSLHSCKNADTATPDITHAIEKEIEKLKMSFISTITECVSKSNDGEEILVELGYGLFADFSGYELFDITQLFRCCAIDYTTSVIGTKIVVAI